MNPSGMASKTTVSKQEMERILRTEHHDPFQVLGPHRVDSEGKPAVAVRAFLPDAAEAFVIAREPGEGQAEYPMVKVHKDGFFEVVIRDREEPFPYWLRKVTKGGEAAVFYDSYSFLPTLTDFDLYLFNAGDHHKIYEKLGAHFVEVDGIGGVQFAVWAPGARSVSVIGSFNGWDRRKHAMRTLGSSGIWEIFIPGLPEGELYKFQIKTGAGEYLDKTDPYATRMEVRPRTASVVDFLRDFEWHDEDWLARRKAESYIGKPVAVYEVHLGSWRRGDRNRWLTYTEFAERLVTYVKEMGYTHIELLPVMEHPLDASWGYQVTGYFAVSSRFGSPKEFAHLVDMCHRNGIGVILDWVPAHFPKDPHGLGKFDGTHLYEHADPRKGEHQDWGTYIFNYGRFEVRNFLISNALFWLEKYHIDGLRIDAVASMLYLDYSRREGEWIPNQYGGRENLEAVDFIKHLNSIVHTYYPGVLTIAEESTAWAGVTAPLANGGLGFDMKWNMGWMHDMLEYFSKEPVHRSYHQRNLTFVLLYAFHEHFLLPLSHDEVVHGKAALLGKMPGDPWQKFANLRLLLGLMYGFPGKKLLFMGSDLAQWDEWQHDKSIDWHLLEHEPHQGIQRWVKDLNALYSTVPSLHEVDFHYSGFQWVDFSDSASSIISFERRAYAGRESVYIVCNFTPVPREKYRVGVSDPGHYSELLNSDSAHYGGGNVGNAGGIKSDAIPIQGRPHSLSLTLPPLAVLFLRKTG